MNFHEKSRPEFINKHMFSEHSATMLIMQKPLFYCSKTRFSEDWAIRKFDKVRWNFNLKTCSKMWCKKTWKIMKNSSKKGAKINQKPIKKRGRKFMQKRSQKDASPLPPANPKEGSLLRREHTEKQQTTENQQWLRKMECERWGGVQRRARSPSRTPTRLGRQRPGADLSCLRQYTRSGPGKIVCFAKARVHAVICRSLQVQVQKNPCFYQNFHVNLWNIL